VAEFDYFDKWRLLNQALYVTVFISLWHFGFRYLIKRVGGSEIGLALILPFWTVCLWGVWSDAYFAFLSSKEQIGTMTLFLVLLVGGYASIATIGVWIGETFGGPRSSIRVALSFWGFAIFWIALSNL
jgi:hypothetical protein